MRFAGSSAALKRAGRKWTAAPAAPDKFCSRGGADEGRGGTDEGRDEKIAGRGGTDEGRRAVIPDSVRVPGTGMAEGSVAD